MEIITRFNAKRVGREKGGGKSLTVPDQSMTVKEIIARTQKGLPVTGVRVPLYNETENGILPDVRNLDISELVELKKRMAEAEKDIRKQLQEQEQKRQEEETEAYYKKKFGKPDTIQEVEVINDPKQ